jgi:uncharacterized RDD family membrane protein YckC
MPPQSPGTITPSPAQPITPPPVSAPVAAGAPLTDTPYAGVLIRFAAAFIDSIILGIVSSVIGFILGMLAGLTGGDSTVVSIVSILSSILQFAIYIAYSVYFIGSKGQTPGKMVMKIKVIKLEDKSVPGYTSAFLREIVGKIASSIVLSLGYFWAIWDPKKQTWHDKIAGTVVVKTS